MAGMNEKNRRLVEYFTRPLYDYRPILLMSIVVTAACLSLFPLQLYDGAVTELLQLSPSSPWGVFTSIFLHRSWEHLGANLTMLWVWNLYIVILPSLLSAEQKKARPSFFIAAIFGSAILSQILWAAAVNGANPSSDFTSVGASGLVYAFAGAVLGFALTNASDAFTKYRAEGNKKKAKFVILANAVLIVMLLAIVLLNPDQFLSRGPGINVFVHGLSFVFGLFAVMARENFLPTIRRLLTRPNQQNV